MPRNQFKDYLGNDKYPHCKREKPKNNASKYSHNNYEVTIIIQLIININLI